MLGPPPDIEGLPFLEPQMVVEMFEYIEEEFEGGSASQGAAVGASSRLTNR